MRIFSKLLAATAVLTAAAPAAAQYYSNGYSQYGNGYNQYGNRYANQYSNRYSAYGYGVNTNAAASQCTAAVQNRLYNRSSIGGILGAVLGRSTTGQVVSVTQVNPRSNGTVRVRGLASSGRYASRGYGAYGVGAYGAAGYGYANAADLSFRCDVGANGAVYNVSINRR
jgi:hypothetical protein